MSDVVSDYLEEPWRWWPTWPDMASAEERKALDEQEAAARAVVCSACYAEAGIPCCKPAKGVFVPAHAVRRKAGAAAFRRRINRPPPDGREQALAWATDWWARRRAQK